MKDSIRWRLILVLAVTALCVFFFFFDTKSGKFSPKGTLKQGLDLRGGVHLVLLMDPEPAVKGRVKRT